LNTFDRNPSVGAIISGILEDLGNQTVIIVQLHGANFSLGNA